MKTARKAITLMMILAIVLSVTSVSAFAAAPAADKPAQQQIMVSPRSLGYIYGNGWSSTHQIDIFYSPGLTGWVYIMQGSSIELILPANGSGHIDGFAMLPAGNYTLRLCVMVGSIPDISTTGPLTII
jgi:hypothetical protein